MSESRLSARRLQAIALAVQALELRKTGETFDAIAARLGYKTRQAAYTAVDRALKRVLQEPTDEVRKIEAERLDALLLAMWTPAQQGDQGAIDRVLRIMERRARLLGIDAPTKIAPTNPEGTEEYGNYHEELELRLSRIAATATATAVPIEPVG